MHAANNIHGFEEAMRLHGLACNEPIVADEKIHRFHVTGDKPGSRNGWYVFFGTAGSYGSWKAGEKFIWSAKGTRIADAIYEQIKIQIAKARSDNKIELRKGHVAVAESSQKEWFGAPPANPKHPYLMTKCVKPHNLRQVKNRLLVPLMDFHSTLWNLQTIYANGEKRFAAGGRVGGLFSPIGMETMSDCSRLVICEGWATGASLYEVMGEIVLCAMNAGNLVKVAQAAREHFPDAELIIAADNDRFTPGNPGLSKAIEAARLAQAVVMTPEFPEGVEGTDYNDAVKLGWRW
jgi:putative DNA primase/helicase